MAGQRLLVLLLIVSGCTTSPPTSSPVPIQASTAPGWSVVSQPSTTAHSTVPDENLDPAYAFEIMRKDGMTPDPGEVPSAGPLRAIRGLCTGVLAGGRCQSVYFFLGRDLLGTIGGMVLIVSQNGKEVVLEYPQYSRGDPLCCPSGDDKRHTVRVVQGKLEPTPPIPADANNFGAI